MGISHALENNKVGDGRRGCGPIGEFKDFELSWRERAACEPSKNRLHFFVLANRLFINDRSERVSKFSALGFGA